MHLLPSIRWIPDNPASLPDLSMTKASITSLFCGSLQTFYIVAQQNVVLRFEIAEMLQQVDYDRKKKYLENV